MKREREREGDTAKNGGVFYTYIDASEVMKNPLDLLYIPRKNKFD